VELPTLLQVVALPVSFRPVTGVRGERLRQPTVHPLTEAAGFRHNPAAISQTAFETSPRDTASDLTAQTNCPGPKSTAHQTRGISSGEPEFRSRPAMMQGCLRRATFLSARWETFQSPQGRTGKSGEPAGWKACPTFVGRGIPDLNFGIQGEYKSANAGLERELWHLRAAQHGWRIPAM
jgi:hypothetical protein